MGRPFRVEFPGAIYHAMARGNARHRIFREERDYQRFLEGIEATVDKFAFEIFGFVCMPNHIHLFFRTPESNLSRGMQYLLSGYANWYNARHQRPGHLFQGRFKSELIEGESYFWAVSRYIHLNPMRSKKPLVKQLEQWNWSSYPGYCRKRDRVDWIAYDTVIRAWEGWRGGKDLQRAADAYRRFVLSGLENPHENPLAAAVDGWLLGSREFVERIKRLAKEPTHHDEVPLARRLRGIPLVDVLLATASHFEVDMTVFTEQRNALLCRDVAAWLARRLTTLTMRELAGSFGLRHPDSVANLTRRADRAMKKSPRLRNEVDAIRRELLQMEK
ncbi:MAG: transposase [Pirellulales bacterium]|nr:transposase [Pirellulales bacterium]